MKILLSCKMTALLFCELHVEVASGTESENVNGGGVYHDRVHLAYARSLLRSDSLSLSLLGDPERSLRGPRGGEGDLGMAKLSKVNRSWKLTS